MNGKKRLLELFADAPQEVKEMVRSRYYKRHTNSLDSVLSQKNIEPHVIRHITQAFMYSFNDFMNKSNKTFNSLYQMIESEVA